MRYLLVYPRRLGDILRLLPACHHLAKQGHEVAFECDAAYHDIFACVDYVHPVAPEGARAGYDRVLDLAIHPALGGTAQRYAAYRASGRSWSDFVYDHPDIQGSYGRPVFTNIGHCQPADYGLPAHGDYVLLAPTASASYTRYDPAKLGAWCHARWPNRPIHVLLDRADKRFPPFVHARRLRDLPAIISWSRQFASINSAAAVIAAAVRPHYVHFPEVGLAAQDDTALAGIAEVVQPYPGERPNLADDLEILRARFDVPSAAPPVHRQAPLRVAFFTTLNHNVGDEFIREGIRAIFDAAGVSYDPYFICKHKPETIAIRCQDEVGDIGDKYWNADVVVQAGAPVYWHLRDGKSTTLTSEWQDWFWRRRVLGPAGRPHPLFLNLGAGSCFAWGDAGGAFVQDAGCADFARRAGARAALTTVREPVAARMLRQLGVPHHALPCPAFLAGARHRYPYRPDGPIGVNLMPLGGHFELDGEHNQTKWLEECLRLIGQLRALGRIVFIAHNEEEEKFLAHVTRPGEIVFRSGDWRPYLDLFGQCALVVANRVHAAVCSSGLGVPAIIIGNDTRAEIGRFMDLPIHRSGHVGAAAIFESVQILWSGRTGENQRLLSLRAETLERYAGWIRELDFETLPTRLARAGGSGDVAALPIGPAAAPLIAFSKTDALGDQMIASGLVKTLLDGHAGHHLVWLVREGIEAAADLFEGMSVWAPNMHCPPEAEAARFRAQDLGARQGWARATMMPVPFRSQDGNRPAANQAAKWWADFAAALGVRLAVAGSATVNWVDQFLVGATGAPARLGFAPVHDWQRLPECIRALWPRDVRRSFTTELPFDRTRDELGHFEALAASILKTSVTLAPALAPRGAVLPADLESWLADSLVIAPGAGASGRALPPPTTAEAVAHFLRDPAARDLRRCVLIQGPGDQESVEQLAAQLAARKIPFRICAFWSDELATVATVLRATRLFLCNDTSYVHLAAFLGTPTTAIWGLGHWPRFVCRTGALTIVRTEMACQGCEWACCFEKWNCVQLLPAAAVARALGHRHGLRTTPTVDVHVVTSVLRPELIQAAMARRSPAAPGVDVVEASAPERETTSAARREPKPEEIVTEVENWMSQGELTRARARLVEATRAAPDEPILARQLGKVCFALGEYREAQRCFEQVIVRDPEALPVLAELAATFLQLKNGRAAELVLAKIFARDPNNVEALRLTADYAAQNGRRQWAVQLYGRLLAAAPQDVAAHFQLGRLLANAGQLAAARQSYQTVLDLEPRHAGAREQLSALQMGTTRPAAAIRAAVR